MTISTPTLHFPPMPPLTPRNVAVIGAGAAGLVAARELRREGHRVVVFDREPNAGGTWIYNPKTDSDPLGLDPSRELVHSSLYASLRTNLPREAMGFRDYPFVVTTKKGHRDPRRFPGHREVLDYLNDFVGEFGLGELVRFSSDVRYVGLLEDGKWKVRSRIGGDDQVDEIYDAVVVCNGHFTDPRIAEIPGIDVWPGKQLHSHNYRVPEPFRDQVVILIGSSASAVDISREIAGVAKEVHIASRSSDTTLGTLPSYDNVWLHSMIESVREEGTVVFKDGSSFCADIILHCTGYKYHFPFLDTNGVVTVNDNRVGPLYKHIFPPVLAPWLSFIGLPWKVVPFPLFEYQSKWIAGLLSGRLTLPSTEDMMADVEAFYSTLEASGIPKRYTHNLSGYQFDYDDWLAAECGCPGIEEWRRQMYTATSKNKVVRPETYRDEWDDDHLVLQAHEDFVKYFSTGHLDGCLSQ
ncbi:flavin-containing monooxygenase FMO GS-OX-like 4 isoform X2 [Cornus florida]|uniref:flavin-containing monooxygenase FMO GS-OX-like 4 isoform X2 n=1 Tax=Cornus florida TaxID=4283 RepID=UPI00289C6779|nr:flavin-containing monooxygenase FMO GS-OX-like 4 isoform X2 [Cornus florida]